MYNWFFHLESRKYSSVWVVIASLLFLNACKKEYRDFPYNDIKLFVVKDANGAELKAAFNNNDIIVYWPPFQIIPDSITPQIRVAERAVIAPASGVKVPFHSQTMYTVTAQDGSVKTYKLVPAVNQPPLIVHHVLEPMKMGGEFEISGEYFIPDSNETKLYLINENNVAFQLYAKNFNVFNHGRINTTIPLSDQLDTQRYTIKLVSGMRSITKGPYRMEKPDLRIQLAAGTTTVKVGSAIPFTVPPLILKYYPLNDIASGYLMTTAFEIIPFQVQITGSTIKALLPTEVTAGTGIYSVAFTNAQGETLTGWEDYLQPLTVIE